MCKYLKGVAYTAGGVGEGTMAYEYVTRTKRATEVAESTKSYE